MWWLLWGFGVCDPLFWFSPCSLRERETEREGETERQEQRQTGRKIDGRTYKQRQKEQTD